MGFPRYLPTYTLLFASHIYCALPLCAPGLPRSALASCFHANSPSNVSGILVDPAFE
uniref:Uncharacterized protein n=1 Tax=Arundo donax TaxID=35708 RepID=A0A0A9FUC9_ARUDO